MCAQERIPEKPCEVPWPNGSGPVKKGPKSECEKKHITQTGKK